MAEKRKRCESNEDGALGDSENVAGHGITRTARVEFGLSSLAILGCAMSVAVASFQ